MRHGGLPQVKEGYTINEVPISLKSNSIITPDAPLRPTQTNIGLFLAERSTIAGESYGIHKSEYSGTGGTKISSGGLEEFATRKKAHIRTGIHGTPEAPINKRCMVNRIKHNEGLFTMNINKLGKEVFDVSRSAISEPLPKLAQKQLFPRSIIFEVEYAKAVYQKAMLEALEKERALFEKNLAEKKTAYSKKKEERTVVQKEIGESKKDQFKQEIHVDDKLMKSATEKEVTNNNNNNKKCASVCATCGCTLKRGVCPKCFKPESVVYEIQNGNEKGWKGDKCVMWPNKKPKYISAWGEERKAELLRVNYPFATEAAAWLYCNIPPFDTSQFYKPSKKGFPERSFSSLNI